MSQNNLCTIIQNGYTNMNKIKKSKNQNIKKKKKVSQQPILWRTPGNDLWVQIGDTIIDSSPYCPLLKTCPPLMVPRKVIVPHKKCDCPLENHPDIPRIGLLDYPETTNSPELNLDKIKNRCPCWGIKQEVRDFSKNPTPTKHWGRNIIELDSCSLMSECVMRLTKTFDYILYSIKMLPCHLNQLNITIVDLCYYISRVVKEKRNSNFKVLPCSTKQTLWRSNQH